MRTNFLRSTLAEESRAYGFTIAFWGSGAAIIGVHELPNMIEALSYGFGAVLGFGILSLLAYRRAFGKPDYEDSDLIVLSMIHYIAALVPIAVAFYLSQLSSPWSHLMTGISTSLLYNLGMLVEESIAEEAEILESKLLTL